jgi:hypothetical protein
MLNKIKRGLILAFDGVVSLFKPNEEGLYFYGQIQLAVALIIIIVSLLFYLLSPR